MSQDPRFLSHSETSWFSKTRRCLKSGECLLFLLPLLSDRELYVDTAGILSLALTEGRLMGLASERAISLGTETRSQLMESMCVCVGLVCTALPSKSTRERPVLAVFLGGREGGGEGQHAALEEAPGPVPPQKARAGAHYAKEGSSTASSCWEKKRKAKTISSIHSLSPAPSLHPHPSFFPPSLQISQKEVCRRPEDFLTHSQEGRLCHYSQCG